jgi:hypothetical protein
MRAISILSSPALSLATTSDGLLDDLTDMTLGVIRPWEPFVSCGQNTTKGAEMARQFAIVFGAVYLLVGILGFILPSPLLGIFGVNTLHNLVHIVIGGLWLVAAFAAPMGVDSARVTSQIIGVVYLAVAILGFVLPDLMNQLLVINTADNVLHLVTAVLALYIGFMTPRAAMVTA